MRTRCANCKRSHIPIRFSICRWVGHRGWRVGLTTLPLVDTETFALYIPIIYLFIKSHLFISFNMPNLRKTLWKSIFLKLSSFFRHFAKLNSRNYFLIRNDSTRKKSVVVVGTTFLSSRNFTQRIKRAAILPITWPEYIESLQTVLIEMRNRKRSNDTDYIVYIQWNGNVGPMARDATLIRTRTPDQRRWQIVRDAEILAQLEVYYGQTMPISFDDV